MISPRWSDWEKPAPSFLRRSGFALAATVSEPFRESAYQSHRDGICISTLARILHIGSATIERIYHQFTERKTKERLSLDCPTILGIDEHTLHKGTRFATTFCDLKNHRVFNVVPGRSPRELSAYVASLKGRERVRVVCIDLSSSYRALIRKWFPNAKILATASTSSALSSITSWPSAAKSPRKSKTSAALWLYCVRIPISSPSLNNNGLKLFLSLTPPSAPLYEQMHKLRALLNQKHRRRRECRPFAASSSPLSPSYLRAAHHARQHASLLGRAHCLHVALHQEQWDYRRLPSKDEAHPAPCLRLSQL